MLIETMFVLSYVLDDIIRCHLPKRYRGWCCLTDHHLTQNTVMDTYVLLTCDMCPIGNLTLADLSCPSALACNLLIFAICHEVHGFQFVLPLWLTRLMMIVGTSVSWNQFFLSDSSSGHFSITFTFFKVPVPFLWIQQVV